MQAPLESHKCQQFLQERNSFDGHMITVQVMAVTDVSPAHQDAVGAFLKRSQKMVG